MKLLPPVSPVRDPDVCRRRRRVAPSLRAADSSVFLVFFRAHDARESPRRVSRVQRNKSARKGAALENILRQLYKSPSHRRYRPWRRRAEMKNTREQVTLGQIFAYFPDLSSLGRKLLRRDAQHEVPRFVERAGRIVARVRYSRRGESVGP